MRIFTLQSTSAEDAVGVIKGLCDDGSGQIMVGVDSRTNSLIVSGEKERHLDVVEAILLRLDQIDPQGARQAAQLEVYSLDDLDPQSVLPVLQTMLAGRSEVRMEVDPKTRNLIVLAPPDDHTTVRETLEKLCRKPASAELDQAQEERGEERNDPESGVQEEPRRRQRALGDILATAQWTTVTEGFVLRVYSDQEVARIDQRRDAYEKRRQEYLAKRTPLDERRESIRRQLPDQRLQAYAQAMLKRYDRDNDGMLDTKEQERMRPAPRDMDTNKDGSITSRELTRYIVQQMRERSNPSPSVESVPENWKELQDELDAIDAKIKAFQEEFEDVLEPLTEHDFYKVIEVTREFIRVRHGQGERIIPFASIREIRRTMHE
ncbi:MAG: secretin N-terminal domain-containing protein [Planctomycetota bacterium]|jgi:Ca2+-binding EF-hand superfamily protein